MQPAISSTSLDNSLCPQVGLTTITRLWPRNGIIIWGQDNGLPSRENGSQEVCHYRFLKLITSPLCVALERMRSVLIIFETL